MRDAAFYARARDRYRRREARAITSLGRRLMHRGADACERYRLEALLHVYRHDLRHVDYLERP